MTLRKCKYCKKKVEQLQIRIPQVCQAKECLQSYYEDYSEKVNAKARKKLLKSKYSERKKEKEKLKTHKDYLKDFERVFNEFIRKRDKGKACISCGKPYGKFTKSAGHYFPAGDNPSIRFDEDNVHLQCWFNCNKNKHGNQAEYLPNLIKKIGQERFDILQRKRHESNKLSIEEIKIKITEYKLKTKEL